MDKTTIEVSQENWQWLNSMKIRSGESFNDVLDRLRTGSEAGEQSPHLPDELDLPGSGAALRERRAAISRCYAYLQQNGTATRSEFLELVDPEAVGYTDAESFWSNCVKGKDTLQSLPGVEPPPTGKTTWRYKPE